MKKSALHMLGVSSPMNQNNEKEEIKTWNKGEPNIIGSSGAFGVIGAGGVKLGVGLLKKGLSKIKSFFSKKPVTTTVTKPVTPVTKPKTKISKPKPEKPHPAAGLNKEELQAYFAKKYDTPSGYYRSDAKGWPLPSNLGNARRIKGTKGL